MVGECSSVIIPIALLNFKAEGGITQGGEEREEGRGNKMKGEDVSSCQEENTKVLTLKNSRNRTKMRRFQLDLKETPLVNPE